MVSRTTVRNSLPSASRSTSSRRRAAKVSKCLLGVVAAAVEALVDGVLKASAGRAEQRGHGEGRDRDG